MAIIFKKFAIVHIAIILLFAKVSHNVYCHNSYFSKKLAIIILPYFFMAKLKYGYICKLWVDTFVSEEY